MKVLQAHKVAIESNYSFVLFLLLRKLAPPFPSQRTFGCKRSRGAIACKLVAQVTHTHQHWKFSNIQADSSEFIHIHTVSQSASQSLR